LRHFQTVSKWETPFADMSPVPIIPSCIILGAGGHARMLIDCLNGQSAVRVVGALHGAKEARSSDLLGIPILGSDELLPKLRKAGVSLFVVGVGATGDNRPREKLFHMALGAGLAPMTVVHPSAIISSKARIEKGAQLLPGCIVNCGAVIGANVIVNSRVIVEHDCVLEEHCHAAPGAILGGNVRVGWRAHVGIGSCIRQGVRIGSDSLVGAGAVVLHDVPDNTVVVGNPARFLRANLD
jgi:UDP-perosamine 4-acetyltransferase